MPASALIIGCGYLGQRVAALWHAQGLIVSVVTRSHEWAAEFRQQGWLPYVADVCDTESLAKLPAADVVLHSVGFDRTSGRTQAEVSVDGVRNVLTQMATRCQRFVYISSSSVYGQSAGEWVDEDSPCEPTQPGGQCCLAAEELVRTFCPDHSNVLRLSGIYGPGRLLSKAEDLRAGRPLSGRPDAWLNVIHVDDAARTVIACAERATAGRTYLVSDDRPVTRLDYYSRLATLIGAPPPGFDDAQPAKRGSGGINKRCSNRRLRTELGVELQYPTITDGLPAAWLGST